MKSTLQRPFNLRLVIVTLICVACFVGRAAQCAPPPPVYDLDSLVWMSEAIVEAKMVAAKRNGYEDVRYFRVLQTFKGEPIPGQELFVEGLHSYEKARVKAENLQNQTISSRDVPLEIDDQVILFLDRPHIEPYNNRVFDAATWNCLNSGVRWLQDDGFVRLPESYYGSFTLRLESDAQGKTLSADEFRQKVRQTIARVQEWRQQINAPLDAAQARWLQQFIIQQHALKWPKAPFKTGNAPSAAAAHRLSSWSEPELLLETMAQLEDFNDRAWLTRGFATPQGREFFLAQLANPKQKLATRLMLAQFDLPVDASQTPDFASEQLKRSYFGYILSEPKFVAVPNPPTDNARWLERLARIAIEEKQNSQLSVAILGSLSDSSHGLTFAAPTVKNDWQAALQVLAAVYPKLLSPAARFQLERIIAKADYIQLTTINPQTGPILSLCSAPEPSHYVSALRGRVVAFEYHIQALTAAAKGARGALILHHLASNKKYQLPFAPQVGDANSSSGGNQVLPVPDWFPRGRFGIFLQFSRGDKIISRGHGFETDL